MARTLNGVEIYDPADLYRDSINTEVLSTIHRIPDLALLMDGTTQNQDAVHRVAATMTGGVGGAWTEESNWQTLLAARAPVIAEATDNLFADEDASWEAGAGQTWAPILNCTLAYNTAEHYHGVRSAAMTVTANGAAYIRNVITAITAAGVQYTLSARFKGVVGRTYALTLYDDVTGTTTGTVITADGTWQRATVTATMNAGSTVRRAHLTAGADALAGNIVYWDAIQLEAKAYATPFALNSRTATTMTFPTATLGLTAGQDMSIVVVTRTPWAGNDGVTHNLVRTAQSGVSYWQLLKLNTNNLGFYVYDAGGGAKQAFTAVTAVNWAADTNHVVIVTKSAAGAVYGYLDDTAFATQNNGAGTGIDALGATLYLGVNTASALQANAPLLAALYNRVLSGNEISLLSRMGAWCQRMKGF